MYGFNLGKGVAIHMLEQQFNGDVKKILDYCITLGVDTIYPKIGNGLMVWKGLDEFIDTAVQRGFEVVPWWYLYGYPNEGRIFGKRMKELERYGVRLGLFDVEQEFDNHKGLVMDGSSVNLNATRNRLRPVALQTVKEYRQETGAGHGLTSWWKPEAHPTPVTEFLKDAAVNMPQIYPMQDLSDDGGVRRLDHALKSYEQNYGWKGETAPFVATFSEHNWTAPPLQTDETIIEIENKRLAGYAAWFLPHIIKFPMFETLMVQSWDNGRWEVQEPEQPQEPKESENNLVDVLIGDTVVYSGQFTSITVKRRP